MTLPSLDQLSAEFLQQPHSDRIRKVVAIAQKHENNPLLPDWLDSLAKLSSYHATMVVAASRAIGATAQLVKLAQHPAARVHKPARALLPLSADGYLDLPIAERRKVEVRLRQEHRTDIIAQLLQLPLSDGDKARLLTAADETTAAQYLADLSDLIPSVARFGQRHPRLVLAELRRRLTDAAPKIRDEAWNWAAPAFRELSLNYPAELLELLYTSGPSNILPYELNPFLGILLQQDSPKVVDLLCRSPWAAGFTNNWQRTKLLQCIRRRRHLLSHEQLVALAHAHRDEDHILAALLRALPPSQREAVFTDAFKGISLATRTWSEEMLEALPQGIRESEAYRMSQLDSYAHPMQQLQIAAYCSFARAREVATGTLHATNAEERALGLATIIRAAGHSRNQSDITEALQLLDRIHNEQDPVRSVVIRAIATIPIALLDLDPIIRLGRTILAARDSSTETLQLLSEIAWSALLHSAQSGKINTQAAEFLAVTTQDSWVQGIPHQLPLPNNTVDTLIAALEPALILAAKQQKYQSVLRLATSLGHKAWGQPVLDKLLEQAISARFDHIQIQAINLWLDNPQTRRERVAALLKIDPTFITLPRVQTAICLHRQDLVPQFYHPKPPKGRFWKGKKNYLPFLTGPFFGWLPEHIAAYTQALGTMCSDQNQPHTIRNSIATIARLPGTTVRDLEPFLASDQVPVSESALASLTFIDDPTTSLKVLTQFANTDRARVAMYSASACALRANPNYAAQLMYGVLNSSTKITSKKEALRILAQLHRPETATYLAQTCTNQALHPDVRIAAGRALLSYLEQERSWQALQSLAYCGRDAALELSRTHPKTLAWRHRTRFATLLQSLNPEPEVLENLSKWAEYIDVVQLNESVINTPGPIARTAINTIIHAAHRASDWSSHLQIVQSLLEASRSDFEPNAEEHADIPHAQRLENLVLGLIPQTGTELLWHREHLKALTQTLGTSRDVLHLTWHVQLAAIDWTDPLPDLLEVSASLDDISRVAELIAFAAKAFEQAWKENLLSSFNLDVVKALQASNQPGAATLALSMVLTEGYSNGWEKPWRDQLRQLRRHPIGAIAIHAQLSYTVAD